MPRNTPILPFVSHRRRKFSDDETTASNRSEDDQTWKTTIDTKSPPPSPSSPPLLPLENWTIPIRNQTNKPGWSKNLAHPSWEAGHCRKDRCPTVISLQRLTSCDDWTPEDQEPHYRFSPFPSLSSTGQRRKTLEPTKTKKIGARDSLRDWKTSLQRSALIINGEARSFPTQILKFPKNSSIFIDFWHVKSVKYQPPLPHDRIHHDTKISFINLPAVLQSWCIQINSQRCAIMSQILMKVCINQSSTLTFRKAQSMKRHRSYSPSKYKGCHEFSSQRTDQSSLFLLWET